MIRYTYETQILLTLPLTFPGRDVTVTSPRHEAVAVGGRLVSSSCVSSSLVIGAPHRHTAPSSDDLIATVLYRHSTLVQRSSGSPLRRHASLEAVPGAVLEAIVEAVVGAALESELSAEVGAEFEAEVGAVLAAVDEGKLCNTN